MYLCTPGGEWTETSARHPESLTVLAPRFLREQCVRTGGKTLGGKPLFRLAEIWSRFMIGGGRAVNFHDEHGNWQRAFPQTVFLPRYDVADEFLGSFVLERWRGPDWYAKQGWGAAYAFAGLSSTQTFEPIWPEGGYEAVIRNFDDPWIFPRDVSTWTIYKAIRTVLIQESWTAEEKLLPILEARAERMEEQKNNLRDAIQDAIGPFGFATYSAHGGFRA